MAQADYIISNQTFPNTRADINSTLQAIATTNSGTSAPTTQYAGQFWIDTTSSTWTLYIHDGSDDIQFATIDTSANTVNFIDSALDVVTDTTPQLGGNLDLNSNDITGTGNINITGSLTASGNLTSLGIDDNATSTAITIDSNERVGIGTTSVSTNLQVTKASSGASGVLSATTVSLFENSGNTDIVIGAGNTSKSRIGFGDNGDAFNGRIDYDHSDRSMRFGTGGQAERMRIDSSGRLILAKTSTAIGDVGISLDSNGKISATRSSDPVFLLNRLSTDGVIADFRKDGATVGLIGAISGDLSIGTGDTGIRFNDGGENIFAFNTSTSSTRDNAVDLGASGGRWKDLYLGGGLYVGGTGTANKLDDYEEGTWTPGANVSNSMTVASSTVGTYTKIGNVCQIQARITFTGGSGDTSVTVTGLPFNAHNPSGDGAQVSGLPYLENCANAVSNAFFLIPDNATSIIPRVSGTGSTGNAGNFANNGTVIILSFSYLTA